MLFGKDFGLYPVSRCFVNDKSFEALIYFRLSVLSFQGLLLFLFRLFLRLFVKVSLEQKIMFGCFHVSHPVQWSFSSIHHSLGKVIGNAGILN